MRQPGAAHRTVRRVSSRFLGDAGCSNAHMEVGDESVTLETATPECRAVQGSCGMECWECGRERGRGRTVETLRPTHPQPSHTTRTVSHQRTQTFPLQAPHEHDVVSPTTPECLGLCGSGAPQKAPVFPSS